MKHTSSVPARMLEMVISAPRGMSIKEVAQAMPCSCGYAAETLRWLAKMGSPIEKTHFSGTLTRYVSTQRVAEVRAEIDAAVEKRKRETKARFNKKPRVLKNDTMRQVVISAATAPKLKCNGPRSVWEWR